MTQADKPLVGIVMGSDSDFSTMKDCFETLKEFSVPCEVRVLSAHRGPAAVADYAGSAQQRGLKVLIGAAGMAAHLAGTLAAHSTLPVIGVPIASGVLQGVDALLATVQMPPGVPVATVGIGNAGAKNAAVLAVQFLALSDKTLAEKLNQHKKKLAESVEKKDARLQQEIK
ncbi:MAG: 5-(carboxyamino)imidazole ribonucleotide mutase [Planctomycetes bacterium]|nr:5-(carboxyamino)imidazole ribonucleotide mutase [Planctomycetota bacterium]